MKGVTRRQALMGIGALAAAAVAGGESTTAQAQENSNFALASELDATLQKLTQRIAQGDLSALEALNIMNGVVVNNTLEAASLLEITPGITGVTLPAGAYIKLSFNGSSRMAKIDFDPIDKTLTASGMPNKLLSLTDGSSVFEFTTAEGITLTVTPMKLAQYEDGSYAFQNYGAEEAFLPAYYYIVPTFPESNPESSNSVQTPTAESNTVLGEYIEAPRLPGSMQFIDYGKTVEIEGQYYAVTYFESQTNQGLVRVAQLTSLSDQTVITLGEDAPPGGLCFETSHSGVWLGKLNADNTCPQFPAEQ